MAELTEIADRLAQSSSFQKALGRRPPPQAEAPEKPEAPAVMEAPGVPEAITDDDVEVEIPEAVEATDEQDTDETPVEDADEPADGGEEYQFEVKIDGEVKTVTADELIRTYQKAGHVDRKMSAFDVEKKTFEKERDEARAKWQERINSESQALEFVKSQVLGKYQGIDWNTLRSEDPSEFRELLAEYQYDTAVINDQIQAHQAKLDEQTKARQAELKQWIEREAERTVELHPEWADEGKRKQAILKIKDHLQKDVPGGFSDEEISQLVDSRYVWLVNRSARLAEIEKSAPAITKKVKAAPKVLKSSGRQSASDTDEVAKLQARFRKTGDVKDLTALRLARKAQRVQR